MITLNTNPGLLRTAVYERILSDLQQGKSEAKRS